LNNGLYFVNCWRAGDGEFRPSVRPGKVSMMISRRMMARVLAAGAVLAVVSPQVFAQSTVDVTLKVPKSCTVTATTNVDFGEAATAPEATETLQKAGAISLKCRKQADTVTVALQKSGAGVTGGTMLSGSDEQAYTLYKPVGTTWASADLATCQYTTAWDAGGLNLGTIGSSDTKTIGVCAKTTIGPATAAGDYTDTLNVVLTY